MTTPPEVPPDAMGELTSQDGTHLGWVASADQVAYGHVVLAFDPQAGDQPLAITLVGGRETLKRGDVVAILPVIGWVGKAPRHG